MTIIFQWDGKIINGASQLVNIELTKYLTVTKKEMLQWRWISERATQKMNHWVGSFKRIDSLKRIIRLHYYDEGQNFKRKGKVAFTIHFIHKHLCSTREMNHWVGSFKQSNLFAESNNTSQRYYEGRNFKRKKKSRSR